MARQFFGTDGVRGRAGEFLTAELALSLPARPCGSAPAEGMDPTTVAHRC